MVLNHKPKFGIDSAFPEKLEHGHNIQLGLNKLYNSLLLMSPVFCFWLVKNDFWQNHTVTPNVWVTLVGYSGLQKCHAFQFRFVYLYNV